MKKLLDPRLIAALLLLFGVLCAFMSWKVRPLHAGGPLSIYGCVRSDDDNLGGFTEVCRVYDPDTGKHFIVSTVRTLHGSGTSLVGSWQ